MLNEMAFYSTLERTNGSCTSWNVINDNIQTFFLRLTDIFPSALFEPFNRKIREFRENGIIERDLENWKQEILIKYQEQPQGPQIFTLDDLGFGFIIILGCLGASLIVFLLEMTQWLRIYQFWRKMKEVKNAKIHPTPQLLKIRRKHYDIGSYRYTREWKKYFYGEV